MTLKSGQRSLKVITTNIDPSAAVYDLLLTFHSNYSFRDKRWFQSKIPFFPTSVYFASPLKGFPLELGIGAEGEGVKTRVMGLPGWTRSLTISSVVWIQWVTLSFA